MSFRKTFTLPAILITLLLGGCVDEYLDKIKGGDSGSSSTSSASSQSQTATIQSLGFDIVSDKLWDDTAVRKVLHTFAYGGHATDEQIATWADMPPQEAIVEMLTFDEHNLKLSPVTASNYDGLDKRDGTLKALGEFWSSDAAQNGVPGELRENYQTDLWLIGDIWVTAATSRGLNPFRQKVGLWETSYHMVTNLDQSSVSPRQVVSHYDNTMTALAMDLPYQDVLTVGATSSGIASQFGHYKNKFRNGECLCNEDFAREYYQLFFGVLGDYDPVYHETVTIKNTARALTDISIERDENLNYTENITFGTGFHYPGILEMLRTQSWGEDMPQRIDQLSQEVINHPESLDNLPIKIISGLADDNLGEAGKQQIRDAWAAMQPKSLLSFLRAYAISTQFHSKDRIKYFTSVDRHILLANRIGMNNEDAYLEVLNVKDFRNEGVEIFRPIHNVFGGQTGIEAAGSADVFRNNYNRVTRGEYRYRKASDTRYGRFWERDWAAKIPAGTSGNYIVREVAEWLWNRILADGLKHFGPLERAHVYVLLATNRDLIYQVDPENLDQVITTSDLETTSALTDMVEYLASQALPLASTDTEERHIANERVGQAINFIVATPYVFAQEGR